MCQHGRLWPAGGAGGEEEPARVVMLDIGHPGGLPQIGFDQGVIPIRAETFANDDHITQCGGLPQGGMGVLGEIGVA